jgi:large subunit ribosomal protein L30
VARRLKTFLLKEESKMAEKKLRVTLVKSTIGAVPKNKKTVEALGLRKVNKTVELPDNDSVRGMLRMVNHLVKVEEI